MAVHRKGITAFLLITFVGSWAGMFGAWYLGYSLADPLVQLGFLFIAFMPAIAAVIVRRWVTREGFGDAGLALRFRAAKWHYLGAWLGPLLMVVVGAAAAAGLGFWEPDLSPLDDAVPGLPGWLSVVLLMMVVPLLAPLYFGEEFGWTSYLRLRLFPDRPLLSTLATGLVWAVWHYPLAFVGYIEFSNTAAGLLVWTVSFLFQEIILSWLRIRSGSVWPASLAHAGNNMVLSLLLGMLLDGDGTNVIAVTVFMTVPMVVVAAWIVLSGRLAADTTADRDTAQPMVAVSR